MRLAIIADVHGNLPALTAVLADIRRRGVERIACLGDLVGYNAFPRETLALLRRTGISSVMGNHDLMAIGGMEPTECGPNARVAMYWTRGVLTGEELAYLRELPMQAQMEPAAILVHSCRGDCVIRLDRPERFLAEREALRKFDPGLRCSFTGHTHTQGVTAIDAAGRVTTQRPRNFRLEPSSFYFINPGSVGHPREVDYRACYAIHDSGGGEVEFHRVRYDRPAMDRENARHGIGTELGLPVGAHYLGPVRALLDRFAGRGGQADGR